MAKTLGAGGALVKDRARSLDYWFISSPLREMARQHSPQILCLSTQEAPELLLSSSKLQVNTLRLVTLGPFGCLLGHLISNIGLYLFVDSSVPL